MSCRYLRIPALIALVLSVLIVPAAVADDTVCKDYTKKNQRIERLGGPQAFSKTSVKSPGELVEQLRAHREEVAAMLTDHGLGHLTEDLLAAAEDSRSLSERPLEKGEVFEWMAWRKKSGVAVATGPLCFASNKTYDAYEILVRHEESTPGAEAKCSVKASGKWDDEKISVDASGSSKNVEVSMSGPGGNKTIISGGGTSWSGMPSGEGTYKFTAKASEPGGSSKVTTYTFVVPKICVNLAYKGSSTKEEQGKGDSCSATDSVTIKKRLPICTITAPAEVVRKETFAVGVTGSNYDSVAVKIKDAATGEYVSMKDENKQDVSELTQFPSNIFSKKTGEYILEGTGTNKNGSVDCTPARFTVAKPLGVAGAGSWTFRGFLLNVDPDDNGAFTSSFRSNGVNERSEVKLGSGLGIGAGLEYRFNDRVGLEGSLLWADLDSTFFFDLDEEWGHDDDSSSFLALTIGPNFHLTPNSRADLYIGPFIGFADIGKSTFSVLGETHSREFDTDVLFGAQLGLDIPFGDGGWGLHLGARYMDLSVDVEFGEIEGNEIEMGLDPILLELGFFKNF